MSFHNKRNSAVGYLTIKALQRELDKRRGKRRRSGMKVAAYVGLGLVSAGILAAALAVVLKRRQNGIEEIADVASESEIVGEYVTAPEPVPAT